MTLEDLLRLALKRWPLVLALVVLGGLVGFNVESGRPATYEAEGRVLIGPSLEQPATIIESTGALARGTLPQTLAQVITGSEVRQAAEGAAGARFGADYDVDSIVIPESNVVEIVVTGPDARQSELLTQAVMEETETAFEAIYPIYDVVPFAAAESSDDPVSPNPELGAVIGTVAGFVLALIAVVALRSRPTGGIRRRLRSFFTESDDGAGDPTPDPHQLVSWHPRKDPTSSEIDAPLPGEQRRPALRYDGEHGGRMPAATSPARTPVPSQAPVPTPVPGPTPVEAPEAYAGAIAEPGSDLRPGPAPAPATTTTAAAADPIEHGQDEPSSQAPLDEEATPPGSPPARRSGTRSRWTLPGVDAAASIENDPFHDLARIDLGLDEPSWLRDLRDDDGRSPRR